MHHSYRTLFLLLVFTFAIVPLALKSQSTTTVTFQPGPEDGNDAVFQKLTNCSYPSNAANSNYGDINLLMARAWSFNSEPESCSQGRTRTFIQFDELSSLPANATVISAALHLYGLSSSEIGMYGNSYPTMNGQPTNPIQIGRVMSSWNEGTLTWNTKPEVDFSDNINHQASTERYSENISIDVTDIVQVQVSGENNGFGIQLQTEELYRSWYWASSNFSNSKKRPKLVVEYETETRCELDFHYTYNTAQSSFTFNPNAHIEGDSYEWTFGDGNTASTNGESVQHIYSNPGTYNVCLTLNDNEDCPKCIDICITEEQIQVANSLNDSNINLRSLNIENLYPNPAKDQITLDIIAPKSGDAEISIYDLTGKKLGAKSCFLSTGQQNIDFKLPEMAPGLYICAVLFDGAHIERKFVIE